MNMIFPVIIITILAFIAGILNEIVSKYQKSEIKEDNGYKNISDSFAVVLCQGNNLISTKKYRLESKILSCLEATAIFGGDKNCKYACLGYGDCKKVCIFGAIKIKDGTALIDREKCTGCKKCLGECPKKIIKMIERKSLYAVLCSSHDNKEDIIKICTTGCIGCRKCIEICPVNAVKMEKNLSVIDETICNGCGKCHKVCPVGAIIKI